MAEFLKVSPKDIIPIPQSRGRYFHIDGEISGLEDGHVAMNHPKEVLDALKKIDRTKLSKANQILLDEHIKGAKNNLKEFGKEYDETAKLLKKQGFKVTLVPGYSEAQVFKDLQTDDLKNSVKSSPVLKGLFEEYSKMPMPDERTSKFYASLSKEGIAWLRYEYHLKHTAETKISFNNGILGETDKGKGYMITNGSTAFPDLEEAFSKKIRSQSEKLKEVHFIDNNLVRHC
jgi:hypothetical protein